MLDSVRSKVVELGALLTERALGVDPHAVRAA